MRYIIFLAIISNMIGCVHKMSIPTPLQIYEGFEKNLNYTEISFGERNQIERKISIYLFHRSETTKKKYSINELELRVFFQDKKNPEVDYESSKFDLTYIDTFRSVPLKDGSMNSKSEVLANIKFDLKFKNSTQELKGTGYNIRIEKAHNLDEKPKDFQGTWPTGKIWNLERLTKEPSK